MITTFTNQAIHQLMHRETLSKIQNINPYTGGGYFDNTKWCKINLKKYWNPGTWVLIWQYSARAIQWIPTWQGLDGYIQWIPIWQGLEPVFQKSLGPCALDKVASA